MSLFGYGLEAAVQKACTCAGTQERARADAVPGQAAQEHQGGRPDAADLPTSNGT
jgi:hypothetical protein